MGFFFKHICAALVFESTFKPSELESSKLRQQVVSDPRPEWKKKIDEINARIMAQNPQAQNPPAPQSATSETQPKPSDDSGPSTKKKSRWQ
ncbi:hypothetical protein OESDEN_09344 [Oesophagostomum dentatum]|uniref:Uncharacterized protein n=1 Tax=Oesophagostomum dentatum TaxID=61180 RepID=A0A0B1T3S7_OESDE|nr:hypothetical protein OESDEN_09344 [Oesophagostomum dentatum]